jgi:hypothetical protein
MMTHVIWVDADDDQLLLNTEVDPPKWSAIAPDPGVTMIVWGRDDSYRFSEVEGGSSIARSRRRPRRTSMHWRESSREPITYRS